MTTEVLLAAAWIVYFALFWRPLGKMKPSRESNRLSLLGVVLQFLGAGFPFFFLRHQDWPPIWDRGFELLGVVLVIGALLLTRAALRHLGENWSLQAQVSSGHRLVTEGPFAWIRHPLYGAFVMLVGGTSLAVGTGWGIAGSALLCLFGAGVRIVVEERLLVEAFGASYRDYSRRVPALFPAWRR